MTTGLRIGEFSRRVGVSAELLRAWERRYELLRPVRSSGGFRLYTEADAERVAQMRRALDAGLSAAEAASVALRGNAPRVGLLDHSRERLLAAVRGFDETAANTVLDELFAGFGIDAVVREVILPALVQLGDEWADGRISVSHEHFGTQLLRGRMLALARSWGRGGGPLALLACAPGEDHDVSLAAFELLLRTRGWRTLFLGADTPVDTLAQAARETHPEATVVVTFDEGLLPPLAAELRLLAKTSPVLLAGPGATQAAADRIGVPRLDGDVVTGVDTLVAA